MNRPKSFLFTNCIILFFIFAGIGFSGDNPQNLNHKFSTAMRFVVQKEFAQLDKYDSIFDINKQKWSLIVDFSDFTLVNQPISEKI